MSDLDFLRENPLFHELSEAQLLQVQAILQVVMVDEGETFIREHEVDDGIYLIKEGEVEVTKMDPKSGLSMHLATLTKGAVVGEIALLDNGLRSASVQATKPCHLLRLSSEQLGAISALNQATSAAPVEFSLYLLIVRNLAKGLGKRIRFTNDSIISALGNELEHARARLAIGNLLICTVCLLSFYIFVLQILSLLKVNFVSTSLVSAPLGIIFGISTFYFVVKTGYPLERYGVTLRNWRKSLTEAIIFSILFSPCIFFYKWILIKFNPAFAGHPFFELSLNQHLHDVSFSFYLLLVFLYVLFVPLQEFIVRGILQGSMQELFFSRYKVLLAIILSNVLFSTIHLHISLRVGLVVMLPGFFWGWLYSRHRTLVGVTVSHLLVGCCALISGIV